MFKIDASKPPKNDVPTPIFQCQYSHFRIPFKKLVDEPLAIPLESKLPPVNPLRPIHTLDYLEKPTYCAWGLKNRGDCV